MQRVKIGIVGCGVISDIYLKNLTTTFAPFVEVKAACDLLEERARGRAETYNIPVVCSSLEMSRDPEIEIILNTTTPDAHALINLQSLAHGKCAYVEKPFAITRADGEKTLALAREKGVLAGGAPDTFLGGGIQTCRKLIDDGWIGTPIAATAFFTCPGHESWHPDPAFYYKEGAGPMFDMGPYYLTALINLLGPIKAVSGITRRSFPTRTITSKPKFGETVTVDVDTHAAGLIDFQCGAVGTIITSFDVHAANLPRIEIYGSRGSLSVPDPNTFGGPISIRRAGAKEWESVPVLHGYQENSRGLGVADMALALRKGAKPRANGDLAFHVLDAMHAFHDSSREGRHIALSSACERPAPLPPTGLAW